jgi:hypothetical protein
VVVLLVGMVELEVVTDHVGDFSADTNVTLVLAFILE